MRTFLITTLLLSFIAVPSIVSAQNSDFEALGGTGHNDQVAQLRTGFEGSPEIGSNSYENYGNTRVSTYGDSRLVTCEGPDCDWCSLVDMVNGLITFVISMLSVIAIIIMTIAGFNMVTSGGDQSKWESAKKMLTSVIIGIVLVLASWLIIDTILSALTGRGINEWLPTSCGGQLATREMSEGDGGSSSGLTGESGAVGAGQMTDTQARDALKAANIGVNKTAAEGTSLQGMNQATINEVLRIKQACGCEVVVTGGTESGHSTSGTHNHGNGYKVDLRTTEGVNDYIYSNYRASYLRNDGATVYKNGNIEYAFEKNAQGISHWDITVK